MVVVPRLGAGGGQRHLLALGGRDHEIVNLVVGVRVALRRREIFSSRGLLVRNAWLANIRAAGCAELKEFENLSLLSSSCRRSSESIYCGGWCGWSRWSGSASYRRHRYLRACRSGGARLHISAISRRSPRPSDNWGHGVSPGSTSQPPRFCGFDSADRRVCWACASGAASQARSAT